MDAAIWTAIGLLAATSEACSISAPGSMVSGTVSTD
jgi:hypothetical protein